MFVRLRILRCPAQWEGNPISGCSSKTVTLTPSLAKFRAAYEPTGPPPITTASGVDSVGCAVCESSLSYWTNSIRRLPRAIEEVRILPLTSSFSSKSLKSLKPKSSYSSLTE